jgi:hypothetical protein
LNFHAADIVDIRAFAIHTKDDQARRFYERFKFVPTPTDPMHLYLLLENVRMVLDL